MNAKAVVLLALTVVGGTAGAARAAGPGEAPLTGKVDAYVKAEIAKRHIPGVSVAVVRDGRLVGIVSRGDVLKAIVQKGP